MFEFLFKKKQKDYLSMNPERLQLEVDAVNSVKKKEQVILGYIRSLPNYNLIQEAESVILDNIYCMGFDKRYNKFLSYVLEINDFKLTAYVAREIRSFITNELLDIHWDWLYEKELYTETENNIIGKIKCLIWASDEKYQIKASMSISDNELRDSNGKLLSFNEMEKILASIKVCED